MLKASQMELPAPIQAHVGLDRISPSTLDDFQSCPRYYFYNRVLGWQGERESIHTIFGSAFHRAIELLLRKHGNLTAEDLDAAHHTFESVYFDATLGFAPEEIPRNKTREIGLGLLTKWFLEYANMPMQVLYTEVAGSVPITEDGQRIHFIIDAIVKHERLGIANIEHKTAYANSSAWRAQWLTALQPKVYTHALFCNFDRQEVFGTIVNGFICTKEPQIVQVLVNQTPEMMAEFLWHLRYLVRELEHNFLALSQSSVSDPILMAFPKRTTNCTKWNRPCPFIDFCTAWANPLQHAEQPPMGLVTKDWEEKNREAEARFTLTEAGIEQTEGSSNEPTRDITVQ